jgi:hypothetical protein
MSTEIGGSTNGLVVLGAVSKPYRRCRGRPVTRHIFGAGSSEWSLPIRCGGRHNVTIDFLWSAFRDANAAQRLFARL